MCLYHAATQFDHLSKTDECIVSTINNHMQPRILLARTLKVDSRGRKYVAHTFFLYHCSSICTSPETAQRT